MFLYLPTLEFFKHLQFEEGANKQLFYNGSPIFLFFQPRFYEKCIRLRFLHHYLNTCNYVDFSVAVKTFLCPCCCWQDLGSLGICLRWNEPLGHITMECGQIQLDLNERSISNRLFYQQHQQRQHVHASRQSEVRQAPQSITIWN